MNMAVHLSKVWILLTLILLPARRPRLVSESEINSITISPSQDAAGDSMTVLPTITQTVGKDSPDTYENRCPVTLNKVVSDSAELTLGPESGIPESKAMAERLILIGTVFARDCTPIPGARLEVWQTDGNGEYGPGHGTNNMLCCYFQDSLQTDVNGMYKLITVKPGHYKGEVSPPPRKNPGTWQ